MMETRIEPEFRIFVPASDSFTGGFSQWLPQSLIPRTVAKLWSLGSSLVYIESPNGGVRQANMEYNIAYLSSGILPSIDKSRAWKGYGS